jgi:hypothetical protein
MLKIYLKANLYLFYTINISKVNYYTNIDLLPPTDLKYRLQINLILLHSPSLTDCTWTENREAVAVVAGGETGGRLHNEGPHSTMVLPCAA